MKAETLCASLIARGQNDVYHSSEHWDPQIHLSFNPITMAVYATESISKEDLANTPTPSAIKEEGNVTVVLANDELEGDEGLHELGYSQQLHRTRGFKETLFMSLTWWVHLLKGAVRRCSRADSVQQNFACTITRHCAIDDRLGWRVVIEWHIVGLRRPLHRTSLRSPTR